VKFIFHITLDVVSITNFQKNNQPLNTQNFKTFGVNYYMSLWKPTKVDVDGNWNLHKHNLKQGVELVLDEPNSRIQTMSYA
jgi:hypothetical protein